MTPFPGWAGCHGEAFALNIMVYPSSPNWDSIYTCLCVGVCGCVLFLPDLISLSCPRNGAVCRLPENPGLPSARLLFFPHLLFSSNELLLTPPAHTV